MGFRAEGLRLWVWGLGFRVWGLGFEQESLRYVCDRHPPPPPPPPAPEKKGLSFATAPPPSLSLNSGASHWNEPEYAEAKIRIPIREVCKVCYFRRARTPGRRVARLMSSAGQSVWGARKSMHTYVNIIFSMKTHLIYCSVLND